MSERRPMFRENNSKTSLALLLMILIGGTLYSNALDSAFVFDSRIRILENPQVRLTRLESDQLIPAAFGVYQSKNRPLSNLTFALNYYLDGYRPLGFRVVNVAFHVLAGFLLFLFLRETLTLPTIGLDRTRAGTVSFWAALLWLVHPVNTQSVTYVIQRHNAMAALFFIAALWLYGRGRKARSRQSRIGWMTAAVLSGLSAMACKQNAASLPFFILLYEWFFFQDLSWDWIRSNVKMVLLPVALFALAAVFYLGADPGERLSSMYDFSQGAFTLRQRALTQLRVVVHYISLLVFPHPSRLNFDHDFPLSTSLVEPVTTLFSGLLILAVLAAAVLLARRHRLLSFSIFWFFGNLAIESSVVPLAVIFEHRTYLPFMAGCLVIVLPAFYWLRQHRAAILMLAALTTLFSVWTYQRNAMWADEIRLYTDAVEKSPNKARPNYGLGLALAKNGRLDPAILHFRKALEIEPDLAPARNALGSALARKGHTAEAIASFHEVLRVDPEYEGAYYNLARVYRAMGREQEAAENFRRVLAIEPTMAEAMVNLVWLLSSAEDSSVRSGPEALALARRLIRIVGSRQPFALDALAAAYAENGDFQNAADTAQKAEQMARRFGIEELAAGIHRRRLAYLDGKPVRKEIAP